MIHIKTISNKFKVSDKESLEKLFNKIDGVNIKKEISVDNKNNIYGNFSLDGIFEYKDENDIPYKEELKWKKFIKDVQYMLPSNSTCTIREMIFDDTFESYLTVIDKEETKYIIYRNGAYAYKKEKN